MLSNKHSLTLLNGCYVYVYKDDCFFLLYELVIVIACFECLLM